jgi:hypothetical protein
MPMIAYARPESSKNTPVIPMAGVNVGVIGNTLSESPAAELVGVGLSEAVVVGTSLLVLGVGKAEGFTDEAIVEEDRSDSIRDDGSSEGLWVIEGR